MSTGRTAAAARRFETVVAEINARAGCGLELLGMAEHGDSGAAYVRWPDGRDGVVTRGHASLDRLKTTADILNLAKSRGLPVPCHDLVVELGDGTSAVIQERLAGTPVRHVDSETIDEMVAINDRFAGRIHRAPP